jgi:cytidine deaminase
LNGTVTGIERHRLVDSASSDRLRKGLRDQHPDLPSDAQVDIVTFSVETPA